MFALCSALIFVWAFVPVQCHLDGGHEILDNKQLKELNEMWKVVSDESFQQNRDIKRFEPPITELASREVLTARPRRTDASGELPMLTGTLLAWITTQTENIVEELEAIAKYNAQDSKLSIKNYVRYLSIYRELGIVAEQNIDELRWVKKKYNIFGKVFESAENVVSMWLHNRETELRKEEQTELANDKRKFLRGDGKPSPKWMRLYEEIKYIADQQSLPAKLIQTALEMLAKSPLGEDRQRNMRYMAARRPVNK